MANKLTDEQLRVATMNGITKVNVYHRLRRGWPMEEAITTPTLSESEKGRRGARNSPWRYEKQHTR